MAKRKCAAITKKGARCKAAPLNDSEHCLAHSDPETRRSMQFVGGQPGSGRPRKPREVDVIREQIEERIGAVSDGLWEAANAERAVVVGNGSSAYVEMVPDHPTRIAAFRELLDRAYGRPKQVSEISGPDGGAITLVMPSDHVEKSRRAAALLRDVSAVG